MLTVREVENRDLLPLSEFLPRGFPYTTKEFWLPLFELWWTSNPAYTDQFPRGWILENETSIVGFIGNIPVHFLLSGVVRTAALSNSWYVDPSVRGIFSIRLFNEFMKQKSTALLLFKKDDESLMGLLHNYKFSEFILPWNQKEYVCVIDRKKIQFIFLEFLLKSKIPQLTEYPALFKKAGSLLSAYLFQKPVLRKNDVTNHEYISSLCTVCDETFSKLWEQNLKSCDGFMSRDAQTLNWLYFSSARLYKRVVIQCHRSLDKTLAGYMVFDITRIQPSDGGIMKLVDICIKNTDPRVLASLTSYAIGEGKHHNCALLIVWADNQETENYFRSTFTMSMPGKYYRYIKFSDPHVINSDGDNHYNVCLPMIYPPQ